MSHHPQPYLFRTMQIGILPYLQMWIFHFMKTHKGLDKYNKIWFSVPAYHDLTPKNKSYEEVSQWNGQAMKDMSWYLLEVVSQSIQGGSPTQHPIVNRAVKCRWALLKFCKFD